MRGIQKVAGLILLFVVFIAIIPMGACYAEEFTMQLPPNPKFTYHITSTNQVMKPGPLELRFARKDSSPFCGRIVQVGVYTSTASSNVGFFDPPGTADPQSEIYTSSISGGAALCNFNFNDDVVVLTIESKMEWYINPVLKTWTDPGGAKSRRKPIVLTLFKFPFKVFLKGNNGGYEWRPVASTNPLVTIDEYGRGYIPIELVCDPIPNTPPVAHSITLSTSTLPASGGPVDITIIAYDDNAVKDVTSAANMVTTTSNSGFGHGSLMGMTPEGLSISEWKCSHYIQANLSPSPRTVTLSFTLTDTEGGVTTINGANAKLVQQAGTPDTTPPKILFATVTPQSLPAAGGVVTVSVQAGDNDRVDSAVISLTRPDGQTTPMTMSLASGTAAYGDWKYSWTVGANTSTAPQTYGIKVTVTDASKNTASSQPSTFTVAGAPSPTILQKAVSPTGISPVKPLGPIPRQP
jgi:hypothetical protein